MQLALAYGGLANNGMRVDTTFIKGGATNQHKAIDPAVSSQILNMLEDVTKTGGTATRAAIKGYRVAGKTGTSRRAVGGGYEKRYISLFAGVVPIDNPRFAMVVVVHEPSNGAYYGGLISAPVFHNVMDGALRLMDVPPDNMEQWYADKDLTGQTVVAEVEDEEPPDIGTLP